MAKRFTIIALIILTVTVVPVIVSAQPIIDPSKCSGLFDFFQHLSIKDQPRYCTLCDGLQAVKDGLELMVKIGVAIAGLIIAYGGILIMVSGANPGKFAEGKNAIIGSMVGIAIGLIAWIVINEIFFLFVTQSVTGRPWNDIPCASEPGGFGGIYRRPVEGAGTGGEVTSKSCEDVDAAKARLSAGGTVCTGGSCPSCDTSPWDASIKKYSVQYGVPENVIRTTIAAESGCRVNPGSVDGKSCGLMQVTENCSIDPDTNIGQGTKKLADAYKTANSLKGQYGNTVKTEELVYSIYNGGPGNSTPSADCTAANGWPTIPKWGCPINPGDSQYNACYIRGVSCNFGSCF